MSDRKMPSPGPEMDALVAELVFGWTRCWDSPVHHWHIPPTGSYALAVPEWSTNTDRATDVLVEMQRQGWDVTITARSKRWLVEVERDTGPRYRDGIATADTFAHAICEAAIRAKWAEEDAR